MLNKYLFNIISQQSTSLFSYIHVNYSPKTHVWLYNSFLSKDYPEPITALHYIKHAFLKAAFLHEDQVFPTKPILAIKSRL